MEHMAGSQPVLAGTRLINLAPPGSPLGTSPHPSPPYRASALQPSWPHSLALVILSLVVGVTVCVDVNQRCGGADRTKSADTLEPAPKVDEAHTLHPVPSR